MPALPLSLRVYPWRSQMREIDPETGRILNTHEDLSVAMWGFVGKGKWPVAVFRRPADEAIVLAWRGRMLRIDLESTRSRYRSWLIASRLRVVAGDRALTLWNLTPGRLLAPLDPAWDEDADQGEDMLRWIHEVVGDPAWAARVPWGRPPGSEPRPE